MSALDTALRTVASGLLGRFGVSMVWTRTTPGAYSPGTGTLAAGTNATKTVYGVVDTSGGKDGLSYGDGLIQTSKQKVMVPAASFTTDPLPGDTLTINSVVWRVIQVQADGVSPNSPNAAAFVLTVQR